MTKVRLDEWFLTEQERGNDATRLPAWSEGNLAEPLVHGAEYFTRLLAEVETLTEGDHLFFTDWRGDPDEMLTPQGPTVAQMFSDAAARGVCVRGLVWRSHSDGLRFSKEEHRALDKEIEGAGGQVLLDQRVRMFGSHHQKLVVIRRPGQPERDVAFAGGIDLCHSRRDDERHRGDPQTVQMSEAYGPHPAWHDVQLMVHGPAVGHYDTVFRERWDDPTHVDRHNPIARIRDEYHNKRMRPTPLPDPPPAPPPCGPHAVQLLRTYPKIQASYRFAPQGERSVARGYTKAVRRARRLIYLEDQYMWSAEVAELFATALRENPELHLVVVVPRVPDHDGAFAKPPNAVGRQQAVDLCRRAAADRVHVFDIENEEGTPIYVHAKVCVIDDTWSSVGSDNFNRRSWTHDSELSSAVQGGTFGRDLRVRLVREHLGRGPGDDSGDLLDPAGFVAAVTASATALDAWHDSGCSGPRPAGRLRHHQVTPLDRLTRLWATPVYRVFYDPDGRPLRMRLAGTW